MKYILTLIALTAFCFSQAQQYTLNGSATLDNCHCYTLTPNSNNQSGSVWNNFKIDLTTSFDFNFDINLGCDNGGADGIVFVLQPISTSVGTTGGGLGYSGVTPAAGITIDTWQNTDVSDPVYDHIAIQLNGNINHADAASNIAGPVTVLPGSDDVEDCQWHNLRVVWDAVSKTLSAYIDGNLRVTAVKDLVADVFLGNPQVFWGFTGSTGGARNRQQFCTALSPQFTFSQLQKRCINEPITFFDSTISFTTVQKRYWDFGDGSNIDSVNANPVHTYTVAGDYTVTQTVVGADGCIEVNAQPLRVGSIPVANFNLANGCVNAPLQFSDISTTAVGTINQWNWNLGTAGSSTQQNPVFSFSNEGPQNISLSVTSLEGCVSATVTKPLSIYPKPVADFGITGSLCQKTQVQFTNLSTISSGSVASTGYVFGNGSSSPQPNPSAVYDTAKSYSIILTVVSDRGCADTQTATINILPLPVADFKLVVDGCSPVSIKYFDSSFTTDGTAINSWWWQLGNNSTSTVQNPVATVNNTISIDIALVAGNTNGCYSDTVKKTIALPSKPIANFGYAMPLCEGGAARFFDSSFTNSGIIQSWQWLVDNAATSTEQHPFLDLTAGNHAVQLIVKDEIGCASDPAVKNVVVSPQPEIDIQFLDACKMEPVFFSGIDQLGTVQSWQWDFGDNGGAQSKDTLYSYTEGGQYQVVLTALSLNGCVNTDSAIINIYSTNASAGFDTIIAAANQPVQLNASGGVNYEWSPADGLNNAAIANPVATNTEDRLYRLRAYTPVGCDSYDTVLVKIYNGPEIYVPTAFNPLSISGNNLLRPIAVGISRFKYFHVYNRFGELVFSTADPSKGWDGMYKGQAQHSGVYIWIAAGTSFRGTEILRKGTAVLLR